MSVQYFVCTCSSTAHITNRQTNKRTYRQTQANYKRKIFKYRQNKLNVTVETVWTFIGTFFIYFSSLNVVHIISFVLFLVYGFYDNFRDLFAGVAYD